MRIRAASIDIVWTAFGVAQTIKAVAFMAANNAGVRCDESVVGKDCPHSGRNEPRDIGVWKTPLMHLERRKHAHGNA